MNDESQNFDDALIDAVETLEREDYQTAYKLFLPLAEQGFADAQSYLGVMYANGEGVPQDYKEAEKWYRLSAKQGVSLAQFFLGSMYGNGKGVTQDYKEAVKWYRFSAEQGNTGAARFLGRMYFMGHGVIKDYVSAHMWWNICGVDVKICVEFRETVEKIMSKQQIEKAQELARNWKPKK